jgi:hypothetical protein
MKYLVVAFLFLNLLFYGCSQKKLDETADKINEIAEKLDDIDSEQMVKDIFEWDEVNFYAGESATLDPVMVLVNQIMKTDGAPHFMPNMDEVYFVGADLTIKNISDKELIFNPLLNFSYTINEDIMGSTSPSNQLAFEDNFSSDVMYTLTLAPLESVRGWYSMEVRTEQEPKTLQLTYQPVWELRRRLILHIDLSKDI